MQVLIPITDTSDFSKILKNSYILKHNFAFVIDNNIKLAYRDWQYQNYTAIKEKFSEPLYVYDYGNFKDIGECHSYRKAFYYFKTFGKFVEGDPVVIANIDYVKYADALAEVVEEDPKTHDGILLDNDSVIAFYWYMAGRFCHAVDDKDKKNIIHYDHLELLKTLARGEHSELWSKDYSVIELER